MLRALLDDRPLAAGELAQLAGVTAATASSHLARLLDGGLVAVVRQGRHRYYRLAGQRSPRPSRRSAHLSPVTPVRSLRESQAAAALAEARTCYDHLAGPGRGRAAGGDARPGPAGKRPISCRTDRGEGAGTRFAVTGAGAGTLASFGINLTEIRRSRRLFAGECIDWTQRRGHLNGALGAAITARLFELGWIARGARRRSVLVTAAGAPGLADTFGLDLG